MYTCMSIMQCEIEKECIMIYALLFPMLFTKLTNVRFKMTSECVNMKQSLKTIHHKRINVMRNGVRVYLRVRERRSTS